MEAANKMAADIEAMRRANEEERLGFELRLAGALSVTAAKALLAEHGGDVAKLKEECPYLFGKDKQTGTTGKKPEGTAGDDDAELDRAFGLKKN